MQSTVRLRLLPSVVVVGIALLVHHRKRGEEENQKAASALISGMEWSFIEKECRKKAFSNFYKSSSLCRRSLRSGVPDLVFSRLGLAEIFKLLCVTDVTTNLSWPVELARARICRGSRTLYHMTLLNSFPNQRPRTFLSSLMGYLSTASLSVCLAFASS